jgi:hypothetical protein
MTASQFIFTAALAVAAGSAAWFGGRDERWAAFALVSAAVLTPILVQRNYAGPEFGLVLVDGLLFAALLGIAMGSRAFWPLWAAGFQLVALAVHLASMIAPHMLPAAYATTLGLWAYPVLASLLVGSVVERHAAYHRE